MPEYDVDREARTEEPTPRRIEEARERAQVARSQELAASSVLAVALAVMWFHGPHLYRGLAGEFVGLWEGLSGEVPDAAAAAMLLGASGARVLLLLAPLAGAVALAAFGVNVLQFGFVAAIEPIRPDMNRIHPRRGLQRMFGTRTLVHLAITVFKVALAMVAMYVFLAVRLGRLPAVAEQEVAGGTVAMMREMFLLAAALVGIFLLLAVLDLAYQRHQYRVDLRMTREELKEELRRLEGDPTIRAHRRAVIRRMLFARMIARVPESDVVVTNPTEFAIAMRYRPAEAPAPVVTAKGRKHAAERIRKAALDAGVPIVERPVLARGLYYAVEPGQQVPAVFWQAIAEVLAYVYRLKEQREAAEAALGRPLPGQPGAPALEGL